MEAMNDDDEDGVQKKSNRHHQKVDNSIHIK